MARWLLPLTVVLFAACGDATGDPDGGLEDFGDPCANPPPCVAITPTTSPPLSALYTQIFNTVKCNTAACHGGTEEGQGKMRLNDRPNLHAELLEPTDNLVGNRTFTNRVVPSMPDESYLLNRLGSAPTGGVRMPQALCGLSQCELDAIREWIVDGAQDN